MPNYNASITYWKINSGNTTIAVTNSGAGTPTEQIAAPLTTPGTATSSGANITGVATTFVSSLFVPGMYLYYVDNAGLYVLVGQIQTVTSNTALVLTSSVLTAFSAKAVVASYNLISISESFYIRISTSSTSSTVLKIPTLTAWRTSNSNSAPNNTSQISLEAYSDVGNPLSVASPAEQVPFTMQLMNVFTPGYNSLNQQRFILGQANKVDYVWLKATPSTTTGLSSLTMYRLTAEESIPFDEINLNNGITRASLNNQGYIF
jgi:hypothetical protein